MANCGIYFILSPSAKIYIGSSERLNRRRVRHFSDLKHGRHHCSGLQRAYDKYGDQLRFIVVELCDKVVLHDREQWWLDNWRSFTLAIYNSVEQVRYTEQTIDIRVKISQSKIGQTKSKETRLRMSDARKGMRFSPEHIENLRKSHTGKPSPKKGKPGKPMTDEHRAKISAALSGKPKSDAHKANLRKPKTRS